MLNKNYSLPASLVVNDEEVWYSNQYRQSEWDGMWYVYKTHFYKHKGNALRWYRQRTIMSDYYAEFNTQKVTKL
jgi:hypothetical protein